MKKKVLKKLSNERRRIFNAKLMYREDTQTWEVVEDYHDRICTKKRFLKTFDRTMPLTIAGYADHYGLLIGRDGKVIDILDYYNEVDNRMRFFIVHVWENADQYKTTLYLSTPNTMEELISEPL